MVELVLTVPPNPPSVNAMYGTNRIGRRYLMPAAKAWKMAAHVALTSQRVGLKLKTITHPIEVHVALPMRTRGDLDNRLKGVLDALQSARIIANDKQCGPVHIGRAHVEETTITITRAGE